MKKTVLLLIFLAGSLFAQTNSEPQKIPVDGYAARVDDRIITYGEVRESIIPYIQQASKQLQGEELAAHIRQAYLDGREALIEEELIKAEAKTLGLALPENVIDEEVDRIIRDRFDGDRALLARALTARRKTFDEWKQEVADQLTVRIYYGQEVTRRASVSLQAVREEYEKNREDYFIPFKVKYRFILINKGKTEEDKAVKKQQAEDTLQKLRDGADFSTVADEVSAGDTAETPWREPKDVLPALRPALRETPAGQISGLIETDSEYYIIKVTERREEGYIPFEEVREQIENKLLAQERERLHKELIDRLSAKHYIERY